MQTFNLGPLFWKMVKCSSEKNKERVAQVVLFEEPQEGRKRKILEWSFLLNQVLFWKWSNKGFYVTFPKVMYFYSSDLTGMKLVFKS